MERSVAALLLAFALAGIAAFLRGDRGEWRAFKALADTDDRQRRYWRWSRRLWWCFALPAIIGLAALRRLDGVAALPADLAPLGRGLPLAPAASGALLGGLGIGFAGGILIVAVMTRRRGGRVVKPVGDTAAILPRTRAELLPVAFLSLSAGIAEELAFRLFLPLTIAIVTGSALVGAIAATLLFGAVHLYQGWKGVAATTLVGSVLMACYVATGALWVAMLLHAATDLSALVLRPLLAGVWRR